MIYYSVGAYLLQVKFGEDWQIPFHLLGGGPYPVSLTLADSGQMPESRIPIIISPSLLVLVTFRGKPMKSQDLVV